MCLLNSLNFGYIWYMLSSYLVGGVFVCFIHAVTNFLLFWLSLFQYLHRDSAHTQKCIKRLSKENASDMQQIQMTAPPPPLRLREILGNFKTHLSKSGYSASELDFVIRQITKFVHEGVWIYSIKKVKKKCILSIFILFNFLTFEPGSVLFKSIMF